MSPRTAHPWVRHAHVPARPLSRLAGLGIALVLVGSSLIATPPSVAAVSASGPATAALAGLAGIAIDPGIRPLVPQVRPLAKVVYGSLPYWRLDSGTAGRLQYDLLSTIAFFGLGLAADAR